MVCINLCIYCISQYVYYTYTHPSLPSSFPEIRGEVSQIVYLADKHLIAVDRNRVLLPPGHNRYFMWGFPDHSARIALVEGDRVNG